MEVVEVVDVMEVVGAFIPHKIYSSLASPRYFVQPLRNLDSAVTISESSTN